MRKHLYSGITLLVTLAIVILSLVNRLPPGPDISDLDKAEHALAYMVLALFATLALKAWGYGSMSFLPVLIYCAALGGGLEIIQSHVGRTMEWADFIADTLGAGAGILAARLFFSVSSGTRSPHRR
ncbi:MAG: VanZ family protein [Spirochaetales bacterium]|nr:VanZ family protein [Spirochaetales bacterium]